jgi:hypothetical protein
MGIFHSYVKLPEGNVSLLKTGPPGHLARCKSMQMLHDAAFSERTEFHHPIYVI